MQRPTETEIWIKWLASNRVETINLDNWALTYAEEQELADWAQAN